jgi:hypothetical protein
MDFSNSLLGLSQGIPYCEISDSISAITGQAPLGFY